MTTNLLSPISANWLGFPISSGIKQIHTLDIVILDHYQSKINRNPLFLIKIINIKRIERLSYES